MTLQQLKEENIMGDYYTINPIHRNIKIFKEHALNDFESYYYTNNGVDWSIDEYKTYLASMIDKAYEEGKKEGRNLKNKLTK